MKNRSLLHTPPRRHRSRRRGTARLFVLSAAFAASSFAAAPPARAAVRAQQPAPAERAVHFAIPPGPIQEVVAAFTRVTGMTVTVAEAGLGQLPSPGVSGVMTPTEALAQLLAGTSLRAVMTPRGARIELAPLSDFVAVTGKAPRPRSPKYTEPLRDTPQTLVEIPQAVFAAQGTTSLRDALRNTPGITLTAGEGGTAPGDNLLIRGFSARNDVSIDGARDPGVVNRDTFNTEAIEVAKGPSSVTAGRGSTGGSINLVTKTASLTNESVARVTGGNAGYKRGTIDLNRRFRDDAAFRVNAMWQDAGVAGRDAVTQRGWGVAPTVGLGLGRPTTVTLSYQHLHENNVPDYGLPGTLPDLAAAAGETVNDLDFSNFYGLVSRDHERMDSDLGTAIVEHQFRPSLTLRSLTRYGRNSLDRVVTPPRAASATNAAQDPGFDPSVAQIRRTDTKYQYRDDQTLTNQTDLTWRFATGRVQHDAVAGLDLAHDRQPSYAATDTFAHGRPPVTDLDHPDPLQDYVPSIAPTGATSEGRSRSAALYAFDTLKLSPRWQVDLGGRFDRVAVDYRVVSAAGVPADFGRTDRVFSGRAGLVFKPGSRASVYAASSTSFNPSYDGSFGLTLASSGANDAALPPERSVNVEGGAKWDVTPSLFATAAVFRTEKTNARTTDESGVTVLAGDQRVAGLELGLSGSLSSRWDVFAGLGLMNGRIEASGNAAEVGQLLSYVPRVSFNAWSTVRIARLTLGGGAQYTDGYFFRNDNALSSANAAAIQSLTEYWLFNMLASYRINSRVSLQANGTNLANARYVDRGYTGHFVPGAGRTLLAGPVITF